MNPLVQLLIQQAPSLIGFIRELRQKNDPAAPQPTEQDIIAAFEALFVSSLARDEFLIKALKAEQ